MSYDPNAGPDLGGLDALLAGGAGPVEEEPIVDDFGDEEEDGLSDDPVEALRAIIAGCKHYLDVEMDEEDKQEATKAIVILQGLLARNQKQADAAMGTTDVHRFMRRQVA